MSPRTKTKVKYVRWVQLFIRIFSLVSAMGLLVCVICIKRTNGAEGWIIRVPVRTWTFMKGFTDPIKAWCGHLAHNLCYLSSGSVFEAAHSNIIS
jgi:hypothetical protein